MVFVYCLPNDEFADFLSKTLRKPGAVCSVKFSSVPAGSDDLDLACCYRL